MNTDMSVFMGLTLNKAYARIETSPFLGPSDM